MAVNETAPGGRSEETPTTKSGPANPQGSADIDMPTPPESPLRSDAPAGPVPPGGPGTPGMPGEPQEVERPQRPVVEPGSEVEPPSEPGVATTSQAEPSDDSGSE